jgi:hypothetical protein
MEVPVRLRSRIQARIGHNMLVLCCLVGLSFFFVGWVGYFGRLTDNSRLDGSIGMLLGLFICSHPASNVLDMLLFMSADVRESITASFAGRCWLLLNLLAMVAGWVTIFSGALRFVYRSI